ncbi:hypothetical protein NE237_000066 [Protea cynaroides]|uniref:Uncharacterized protein n=1 Tax=Protea cynaroides TaxID=273540 RepID=A0A9Q0JRV1_9MAGN|nr:hypothetical protein NE237_000066 [Protea cynaroides]
MLRPALNVGPLVEDKSTSYSSNSSSSSSNFINRNDYSYGSSSSSSSNFINRNGYYYGSSSSSSSNINEVPDDKLSLRVQRVYINWETIEKGFLFSKLPNNSDSGKLNRLLIPIRKAEKYFPSLKKGDDKKMLLTFFIEIIKNGSFVNEYRLIGFVHEVFFYKIHDQLEVSDDQPLFIDFKEKVHDQQEVSDDQPLFINFKKEEPPPTNPTSWLFGQNLILHKKDPPPTRLFGQNLIPHDQLEVSDDQHLFNDFKKKDPPPTRLFGQNLIPHDQLEKKDPPPTRLFGQNLILHDQLEVSDDPPGNLKCGCHPFSWRLCLKIIQPPICSKFLMFSLYPKYETCENDCVAIGGEKLEFYRWKFVSGVILRFSSRTGSLRSVSKRRSWVSHGWLYRKFCGLAPKDMIVHQW